MISQKDLLLNHEAITRDFGAIFPVERAFGGWGHADTIWPQLYYAVSTLRLEGKCLTLHECSASESAGDQPQTPQTSIQHHY